MTEQAAVLIKFQTCDLARDLAVATAAYDSDPQTAWIAPFTVAQLAYWSGQAADLLPNQVEWPGMSLADFYPRNKYADDLSVQRATAITNAANSAYNACVSGGASSDSGAVADRGFRLAIQTQLEGGSATLDSEKISSVAPSTQVIVPFSATGSNSSLDWKPFYKLGAVSRVANNPSSWEMDFEDEYAYDQPAYVVTPTQSTVKITVPWLHGISADFEKCIDYPNGMSVSVPDELSATFTPIYTRLGISVTRYIKTPDGVINNYNLTYPVSSLSGGAPFTLNVGGFPAFITTCEVSGEVEVHYVLEAFAALTQFDLDSDIEQLMYQRDDINYTPKPLEVKSTGSTIVVEGVFNGFNSVARSFNYVSLHNKLGVVRVSFYNVAGGFVEWKGYLIWLGDPVPISGLSRYILNMRISGSTALTDMSGNTLPVGISIPVAVRSAIPAPPVGFEFLALELPVIEDVHVRAVLYQTSPYANLTQFNITSGGPTSHVFSVEGADVSETGLHRQDLIIHGVLAPHGVNVANKPFLDNLPDIKF